MNSHNPFNTGGCPGGIGDFRSADALVDRLIGDAYHVVKEVYLRLGQLDYFYTFLNKYGVIAPVESESQLKDLPVPTVKFARLYSKTAGTIGTYYYLDYLYLEGDLSGIRPNVTNPTGSWKVVGSSGSAGSLNTVWRYDAVANTNTVTLPTDIPVKVIQAIYLNSGRLYPTDDFTFDANTGVVTFADDLVAGEDKLMFILGLTNPEDDTDIFTILSKNGAASLIGTESGNNIQQELDLLNLAVSESVSKAGLKLKTGLSLIGQFDSVIDLRTTLFTEVGQQVFLKEHTVGQGAGGGIWYFHKAVAESTDVDDNGCQIINNWGQVIRRKDVQNLYTDMFGLGPGGDFDATIQNMFKASRTFNIVEARVCQTPYSQPKPRSKGGNVFDLSDGMSFDVIGVSATRFGSTIVHNGDNICMRFIRNHNDSKEFWISARVANLRIVGQGTDFTGSNLNTQATAIEFSDMWGAKAQNLFIAGYLGNTSGAAISLYNETAWTEGTTFDDVVIRNSITGLWLHRDISAGTTARDSFFRLHGNLDINAGVSGSAINYVRVGNGTAAGACLLYGHDLTITGWMSNGSWHNGVLITDYSTCKNGKIRFNFDGYGVSSSATTEVVHLIRIGGPNALFECDVENTSGQTDGYPLSMLKVIANSCLYLDDSNVFNGSLTRGRPIVRPRGMVMRFTGTFTQAECISGMTFPLSGLTPGMRLRVRLNSWGNNSKYETLAQEWDVEVRGTDFPCIVKPYISTGTTLSTTNVTGLVNGVSTVKDSFMKSSTVNADAVTAVNTTTTTALNGATLTTSQVQANATFSTSLTLNNGQASNPIGYLANSGRKINIVLPADTDATQPMPYAVEIEVM